MRARGRAATLERAVGELCRGSSPRFRPPSHEVCLQLPRGSHRSTGRRRQGGRTSSTAPGSTGVLPAAPDRLASWDRVARQVQARQSTPRGCRSRALPRRRSRACRTSATARSRRPTCPPRSMPALRLQLRRGGRAGYSAASDPARRWTGHERRRGRRAPSRRVAPATRCSHGSGSRRPRSGSCRRLVEVRRGGTLAQLGATLGPPEMFLGPLGNMGPTAYVGLVHAAELRDGDVISSRPRPAPSAASPRSCQLHGHRVIGRAGSPRRGCATCSAASSSSAASTTTAGRSSTAPAAAPERVDVFFDNVGGDHLQAALATLRRWGQVTICGAVSRVRRARAAARPRPTSPRGRQRAPARGCTRQQPPRAYLPEARWRARAAG